MIRVSLAFPLVLILSASGVAMAAEPVVLDSEVKLEATVTDDGVTRTVLVDPKVVVPGDRLLFVTRYRNGASAPVRNFVVTNPLPNGVALATDADPALALSVDGGKSWGLLAALTVPVVDGVRRAAQASDVTHVRWTLPLIAPAQDGAVSFHAVVE